MYCPKCGTYNPDNSYSCSACGAALQQSPSPQPSFNNPPVNQYVPNYLVQSILVTLLFCLPAGIIALIYSSKIEKMLRMGDYKGAVGSSKKAKIWCWVGFGVGLIIYLFGLIGIMLYGL